MAQVYNVYSDESCHLEHDSQQVMILGAVWCPLEKSKEIAVRLREIKVKHGLKSNFEIKWSKVSKAKIQFYLDLVDYFFDHADLHFRALIIPDKTKLDHDRFEQTHDVWYYKMYFNLLKVILNPNNAYRFYIDIKDTRGGEKIAKLKNVLSNSVYDISGTIIERMQIVRSHEVEIIQLADLLIGALSYLNRGLEKSEGKKAVIDRIRKRSGYSLNKSTLFLENKFNIFKWRAAESEE